MASSIESAFLGLSFSASLLSKVNPLCAKVISLAPPASMILSAFTAARSAHGIQDSPAFAGMLSFSLIALLFMVLEELLVEARETKMGDVTRIGIWFYVGLLVS